MQVILIEAVLKMDSTIFNVVFFIRNAEIPRLMRLIKINVKISQKLSKNY